MRKIIKWALCICLCICFVCIGHNCVYAENEVEAGEKQIVYKWLRWEDNYYYYYYVDENNNNNYIVGWKCIDGHWYYFDTDGKMISGWRLINGKTYYFGTASDGKMRHGWQKINDTWYFFGGTEDGKMATGWNNVGGSWYYFSKDGSMKYGWQKINGRWYFLGDKNDGAMKSGWLKNNTKWYYLSSWNDGAMKCGWQRIGATWYLFATDGHMLSGWQKINNSWYYLGGNNDGAMKYGWKYINSNWYYFGGVNDGIMKSGWQYIGNKWYYFYRENDSKGGTHGAMASNRNIDGYYVSKNGDWIDPSWLNSCAQGYSSSTKYLILVDRSSCMVGIYQGSKNNWKLKYFWPCAPGKASTPTISGEYNVAGKGYYFDSGNSRCFYYTQFKGNYLFHSVLYNKNGTLQDGRVGIQLSHGCVRLEINNAKWIYDNIPRGTHVVIY